MCRSLSVNAIWTMSVSNCVWTGYAWSLDVVVAWNTSIQVNLIINRNIQFDYQALYYNNI